MSRGGGLLITSNDTNNNYDLWISLKQCDLSAAVRVPLNIAQTLAANRIREMHEHKELVIAPVYHASGWNKSWENMTPFFF